MARNDVLTGGRRRDHPYVFLQRPVMVKSRLSTVVSRTTGVFATML